MGYASLGAFFIAPFLGWLAGMFTYQRSRRWCTGCGQTLTCPVCRPASVQQTTAPTERQP